MNHYDVIVLGVGGVGSAALFELARRKMRVIGLDRFAPGHDRGSSHGSTRIIRRAYAEHPDYVPLALESYAWWNDVEARTGQVLFEEVGLLMVGPADGEVIPGVRTSARLHGLDVEELTPEVARTRFAGFVFPPAYSVLFERRAGFLHVEKCVLAHVALALAAGAELRTGVSVRGWRVEGNRVIVETDDERFTADRLVIAAGAWAPQLLADLGIAFEVRRKSVFWYETSSEVYESKRGCSCFMYELPNGIFYGLPQINSWGVKAAEHTGGATVLDPLSVDRQVDAGEQQRIEQFLASNLPGATNRLARHSVCLYTMTPDANFVVDTHPRFPQVVFAAGLSGHGFKFTGVLGRALADLALEGRTSLPIQFLSSARGGLRL